MHQTFLLLLIAFLAVSSLSIIVTKPANAQTIPIPTVPQFTVRLVNNSYATQPTTTTSTDPYTGKQSTVTTPSHYMKNEYIEVSVKNQPFTPYKINYQNIDSRPVNLYFDVIAQGHFTTDRSLVDDSQSKIEDYNAPYTNFTLYRNEVPSPAALDFKVRAMIGYLVNQYEPEKPLPPPGFPPFNYGINGSVSNWSNTQTITIGDVSPYPSPSPTVPELSWLTIIPLLLAIPIVLIIFRKRVLSRNSTNHS